MNFTMNKLPEVLMITHGEKWGAGRAASRLFDCFNTNRVPVTLLTAKKDKQTNNRKNLNIYRSILLYIYSRFDYKICKILEPKNNNWKTMALLGVLTARSLNKNKFGILNLHWVGHGLISLRQLNKIKKPIVWTVNDEWLLNPISHYPYVPTDENGILRWIRFNIERNRSKLKNTFIMKDNVYIVSVSKDIVEKFCLKYPKKLNKIYHIPNPVDTGIFFPELKNIINLPVFNTKSKVVLFLGGTKDQRKGWDLLENSLEFCESSFVLLVVGGISKKISGEYSQIEVIGIHNISNIEELRSLYSRSNLVVVPSRIEALPQTATEALSCGTPVVGFDIGGLRDIIVDGKNGILVPKFDVRLLSSAIDKILSRPKGDFTKSCIDFSSSNFSFEVIASKYKDIFINLSTID